MFNIVKRTLDIILSLIAIIILSPFFIIISLLIIIDTPGPIFADIPPRVGKGYKPFKMYKFRSMVQNAHEILRQNPKFAKLFEDYKKGSYKLKNDPRVTKIGKFIRKYSIDEFPQFFNILKGDMSLVGPRAYYFDELEYYISQNPEVEEDIAIITSIKPGLTGVWQISGRSEISFDKRIKIDLEYAKMRSIKRNVIILFKTPFAVFSKRGAY